MKVKISQSFAMPAMAALCVGEVLDVPQALGRKWIKARQAVAVTEEDVQPKETQQKPTPVQVPSKVEQAERAVKPQPEKRTR